MSLEEFKTLNADELKEREKELRKHLFDLRAQTATEKVKDLTQFKKTKRDIARIHTLVRQRELEQSNA